MGRRVLAASFASLALLFASATARADDFDITGGYRRRSNDAPPTTGPRVLRFGRQGEIVLSTSATSAFLSSTHYDGNSASSFGAGISPGFDYFVVRHFSIGLDLEGYYSQTDAYGFYGSIVRTTRTTFAAGPRIGVDFPLGEGASIYPRVTFGFESVHLEQGYVSNALPASAGVILAPTQTNTSAWLNVFAPVLAHPSTHFFIGAGPRVFHAFGKTVSFSTAGGDRTAFGAELTVGGHWGGETEDEPDTAKPPVTETKEHRFGEAMQVVLTGDLTASLQMLEYAASPIQFVSAGFAPGVDVFVVDHLSVGLEIAVSYASASTYSADGTRQDLSQAAYAVGPRVGVDVPLTSSLSFYPRGQIGFGVLHETKPVNGLDTSANYTHIGVSLDAPLLVHPAPHFFVGFGPTLLHELVGEDSTNNDNRRTTLGARLLLGGWL